MGEGAKRVTTARPSAVVACAALRLPSSGPSCPMGVWRALPHAPDSGQRRPKRAALQHRHWRSRAALSSALARLAVERFLQCRFRSRAVAGGRLRRRHRRLVRATGQVAVADADRAVPGARRGELTAMRARRAISLPAAGAGSLSLAVAAGCAVVWTKSAAVGRRSPGRWWRFTATVLAREEQPAEKRVRLVLATREPGTGRALKCGSICPWQWTDGDIAGGRAEAAGASGAACAADAARRL